LASRARLRMADFSAASLGHDGSILSISPWISRFLIVESLIDSKKAGELLSTDQHRSP